MSSVSKLHSLLNMLRLSAVRQRDQEESFCKSLNRAQRLAEGLSSASAQTGRGQPGGSASQAAPIKPLEAEQGSRRGEEASSSQGASSAEVADAAKLRDRVAQLESMVERIQSKASSRTSSRALSLLKQGQEAAGDVTAVQGGNQPQQPKPEAALQGHPLAGGSGDKLHEKEQGSPHQQHMSQPPCQKSGPQGSPDVLPLDVALQANIKKLQSCSLLLEDECRLVQAELSRAMADAESQVLREGARGWAIRGTFDQSPQHF